MCIIGHISPFRSRLRRLTQNLASKRTDKGGGGTDLPLLLRNGNINQRLQTDVESFCSPILLSFLYLQRRKNITGRVLFGDTLNTSKTMRTKTPKLSKSSCYTIPCCVFFLIIPFLLLTSFVQTLSLCSTVSTTMPRIN